MKGLVPATILRSIVSEEEEAVRVQPPMSQEDDSTNESSFKQDDENHNLNLDSHRYVNESNKKEEV